MVMANLGTGIQMDLIHWILSQNQSTVEFLPSQWIYCMHLARAQVCYYVNAKNPCQSEDW